MMKTSINKVELNGYLGKDPEYKKLENGTTMMRVSVATNDGYKDKTGQWVDNTNWHNVVLWKEPKQSIKEALKKGARVAITGKLQNNKYTDKNGQLRYVTDVVAFEIEPDETPTKNE